MGLANSFIVYDKIVVLKLSSPRKNNIAKNAKRLTCKMNACN